MQTPRDVADFGHTSVSIQTHAQRIRCLPEPPVSEPKATGTIPRLRPLPNLLSHLKRASCPMDFALAQTSFHRRPHRKLVAVCFSDDTAARLIYGRHLACTADEIAENLRAAGSLSPLTQKIVFDGHRTSPSAPYCTFSISSARLTPPPLDL